MGFMEKTPELIAVIELGTTSLRMEIAEIKNPGTPCELDFFQQPVSLGKDTFTTGRIDNQTIEACVEVLRGFRSILNEYRITDSSKIKAIATSAVREASNRDTFLNRIYIATGINVHALDKAEGNRLNCLAVTPLFKKNNSLKETNSIVVEVGGGSTEVLIFERGRILNSHTHRLGSLRIQKMFEDQRIPVSKIPTMMKSHVERSIQQMIERTPAKDINRMIILGGDARFAATLLKPGNTKRNSLVRLMVRNFSELTEEILRQTPDELVKRYYLAYPDAETLAPAMLIYSSLAKALKLKSLLVGPATLRDGALTDMATGKEWTDEFINQVIHSAVEIGEKYDFDKEHAMKVAGFSLKLFKALQAEHNLGPGHMLILHVAAILHDIGTFVSIGSHHKHSMYLIQNSDIFGLSSNDLLMTSLVARYHRRSTPQPSHPGYNTLEREDRIAVAKLAAILRVADVIDRRHLSTRRKIQVETHPGLLRIIVNNAGDLSLEKLGLTLKADMFEQVYGMKVELAG